PDAGLQDVRLDVARLPVQGRATASAARRVADPECAAAHLQLYGRVASPDASFPARPRCPHGRSLIVCFEPRRWRMNVLWQGLWAALGAEPPAEAPSATAAVAVETADKDMWETWGPVVIDYGLK